MIFFDKFCKMQITQYRTSLQSPRSQHIRRISPRYWKKYKQIKSTWPYRLVNHREFLVNDLIQKENKPNYQAFQSTCLSLIYFLSVGTKKHVNPYPRKPLTQVNEPPKKRIIDILHWFVAEFWYMCQAQLPS